MSVTGYDRETLSIGVDFIVDVVSAATQEFNLTYDELNNILKDLRYWEVFNNLDLVCVGAHEGVRPILDEIRKYMSNGKLDP